ncbi:proton channel OTOP1-like [Ambystoma mexicanum]|uniref:proton channel OTOP1-like n=1 Tax=Ambystoma mexicanum TaxID=8296 RepID=UPI0037E97516
MSGDMAKDNASSQDTVSVKSEFSTSYQEKNSQEKNLNFNIRKNYPQKSSEVVSSQYGINIFLAGLFLMFAGSLNINRPTKRDIMCYLIVLMLLQLLWMLWYILISKRQAQYHNEKDFHAGARWIRCGIASFAGISLILDALKLGYFLGYSDCLSVAEGVFPVTHAIHTIVQVIFLWFHSKDIIQSFKTLERFGLIHSVFTNLLLWASEVFTESKHQLVEHMDRLSTLGFENMTFETSLPACNCTTDVCRTFGKAIYYLYPFNIEYHIMSSAMLYVLWKNIGSTMRYRHEKSKIDLSGTSIGNALGLCVLVATIAVTVFYLLFIGKSKRNSEIALAVYYLYCAALLMAMCLATTIGLLASWIKTRIPSDVKSPALKLDVELLVGSACGSWLMSWGSILAIIYADSHPVYTWYNLPYSILVIIEKYVQNLFIIECIHYVEEKAREEDTQKEGRVSTLPCESPFFPDPPFELLYSEPFTADNEKLPDMGIPKIPYEDINAVLADVKNEKNNFFGPPACDPQTNATNLKALSVRRRILRTITVFLFLCNISLWIPPAFGCRPQYDNGLEETVFGFRPWIILIDIALPFSIFYRMHSVYSLFDVYIKI